MAYIAAGTYYREINLSQIIAQTATTIGAIVLASKKGRINIPILVTNTAQFIAEFGEPDAKISFGHYAALAFLEQAQQLYVVRVAGSGYSYGGLVLQKKAGDSAPILFGVTTTNPEGFDFSEAVNGSTTTQENLLLIYPARGPGGYSKDVAVEIVSPNIVTPTGITHSITSIGGTLASGSLSYKVSALNRHGETIASTAVAVTIASGTTNTVTLAWPQVSGATSYRIYGRTAGSSYLMASTVSLSWTDDGSLDNDGVTAPLTVSTITAQTTFDVNVYDYTISTGRPVETHEGVSLSDLVDGLGQQKRIEEWVNASSSYIRVVNNTDTISGTKPLIYSLAKTVLATGVSGAAVTDSQINLGWELFRDPEKTTIRLMINGGYASPAVQKKMDTIASARQDCIAFLDAPSTKQKVQDLLDYRNITLNLNSNRSALFAQDLYIQDDYSGKRLYVPPSGHMAARAAYTDFVAYPWFAIAGLNRGQLNVLGVRHQYESGERDLLAGAQINYVRNFPGEGLALFEQKTLAADLSALSWISVRRMLDVIQVSIRKYLNKSVHEPNDDFLRNQIVSAVSEFLQDIQNKRGLNRWLVKSDATNNPSIAVGRGELNIYTYLEPTLPAEKIILTSIITKQGVDFTELEGITF